MTDERLRGHQRRADQGDPDAEAALLAERLRAGVLTTDFVRLAAKLGSPPAMKLMPEVKPAKNPMIVIARDCPTTTRLGILSTITECVQLEWQARSTSEEVPGYRDDDDAYDEAECEGFRIPESDHHDIRQFIRDPSGHADTVVNTCTALLNEPEHWMERSPALLHGVLNIVVRGADLMVSCGMIARDIKCSAAPVTGPWTTMTQEYARFLDSLTKTKDPKNKVRAKEMVVQTAIAALLADR